MSYERRIEKGMALLDERLPGWERKIDLGILNLESGCDCVLGQLALDLGVRHDPREDPDEKFIEAAVMLWPIDSCDAMLRHRMNNPASNFGATPAGGVYEGKPDKIDGSRIVSPKDPRQFLIDLDNQLSGAIRNLRSVRQAIQKETRVDRHNL